MGANIMETQIHEKTKETIFYHIFKQLSEKPKFQIYLRTFKLLNLTKNGILSNFDSHG